MKNSFTKCFPFLVGIFLATLPALAQLKIDSSFNGQGFTHYHQQGAGTICSGTKIVYDNSGKMMIAGKINDSLALFRYTASGMQDLAFGNNGYISISGNPYTDINVKDIVILPSNKIMVMAEAAAYGSSFANSQGAIMLARFTANGAIDSSFNGNGIVVSKPDAGYEYFPKTMAVSIGSQSPGEATVPGAIYVGGLAAEVGHYDCSLGFGKWFISKYTDAGQPDLSFNNNTGYMIKSASEINQSPTIAPPACVLDLKVVNGGKLLAAGALHYYDSSFFSLKLNSDGTYDNSYGTNGRKTNAIADFGINYNQLTSAFINSDETILFTRSIPYNNNGADSNFLFGKLTDAQGSFLSSFGGNGLFQYFIRGFNNGLIREATGKILISWYEHSSGTQKIHFTRFEANGAPDTSFGVAGHLAFEPILNDTYSNPSDVYDMAWNANYTRLGMTALRSGSGYQSYTTILQFEPLTPPSTAVGNLQNTKPAFDIFPNPAQNTLNLLCTDALSNYQITDLQGRILAQADNLNGKQMSIATGNLPPAMYLLRITTANGVKVVKTFVKE